MGRRSVRTIPARFRIAKPGNAAKTERESLADAPARYRALEGDARYVLRRRWDVLRRLVLDFRQRGREDGRDFRYRNP